MEWFDYFIKKALKKMDAHNKKQAHLFLTVEYYKWA